MRVFVLVLLAMACGAEPEPEEEATDLGARINRAIDEFIQADPCNPASTGRPREECERRIEQACRDWTAGIRDLLSERSAEDCREEGFARPWWRGRGIESE